MQTRQRRRHEESMDRGHARSHTRRRRDGRRSGGVGAAGRRRESRVSGELGLSRRPSRVPRTCRPTRPSVAHTPWATSSIRPGTGWGSETTYTLPLGVGPPACPAGLGKPLATTGRLASQGRERSPSRCPREHGAWVGRGAARGRSRRSSRSPAAQARSPRPPGKGRSTDGPPSFPRLSEASGRDLDGDADGPRAPLTAPRQLSGAVAKTVRAAKGAKSARVAFKVTATDNEGGDVPVSCWPRSGSRFPLGKTMVLCAATDSTGNTATAGSRSCEASAVTGRRDVTDMSTNRNPYANGSLRIATVHGPDCNAPHPVETTSGTSGTNEVMEPAGLRAADHRRWMIVSGTSQHLRKPALLGFHCHRRSRRSKRHGSAGRWLRGKAVRAGLQR